MPWVLLYKMSQTILPPCLEFWSGLLFSGERQYPYEDYVNQGAWSFLPSQLHTAQPHLPSPVPSSTDQLFVLFSQSFLPPLGLAVSWFPHSFPLFPTSLQSFPLNSYFQCSCSLHISSYLNTFSPLSKVSFVPASFHSALCQCSSQTTNAVSEISLTRGF